MIIADTSGLIAFFSESGPQHEAVASWVEANDPVLVVSPYVVAEVDYLVATRKGVDAELAVLAELSGGAYELADMDPEALAAARRVVARYRDLGVGVADASLAVLAERYRTRTVLTLDRKHFSVMRPLDGGTFKIVP
ncbi:MAG: PIN domain-containing protein [Acidimicrobiaceae bacterium]|nr:PIN domain-containing protein [Acidimicrobiaceae bacterium]